MLVKTQRVNPKAKDKILGAIVLIYQRLIDRLYEFLIIALPAMISRLRYVDQAQ